MQEMRFLFAHYCDLLPESIVSKDITAYINFIIKEHVVGREKCHQVAQACSFFFKHVMPTPFAIPSQFYPRKENKLPQVFSIEQVKQNGLRQLLQNNALQLQGIEAEKIMKQVGYKKLTVYAKSPF